MADIIIPAVGVGMEEALLLEWLKQPGEPVEVDEPVVEIETDKATMELVSPAAGRLGEHLFATGAIVPVGTAIARVIVGAEEEAGPPAEVPAPGEEAPAPASAAPVESRAAGGADTGPHALSPRARRLAAERLAAAAEEAPETPRFRELIAAKVAESWRQIPHFAVVREVNAEPMLATLAALRASGTEPKATLTDLMLRALARALREVQPGISSDIGLAVATPHGVVIPVVRNVLGLDAPALAQARLDAVERALAGRLGAADLDAPPTTLSNLGAHGIDQFTGIIALGQASLLTVGRAVPRAVVADDGALHRGTTFHATLNADHRTLDGAEAARLLVAFAVATEQMTPNLPEDQ